MATTATGTTSDGPDDDDIEADGKTKKDDHHAEVPDKTDIIVTQTTIAENKGAAMTANAKAKTKVKVGTSARGNAMKNEHEAKKDETEHIENDHWKAAARIQLRTKSITSVT